MITKYGCYALSCGIFLGLATNYVNSAEVADPGPRLGAPSAGAPLSGLSATELALFNAGLKSFGNLDTVDGANDTDPGLGPRFNLNSCGGCHAFPAVGGSGSLANPQAMFKANEKSPHPEPLAFVTANGPTVEVRFKCTLDESGRIVADTKSPKKCTQPDGGVHALFTISGRSDAGPCVIEQPAFQKSWDQNNVTLRIPTPVYGEGLIEAISDEEIANHASKLLKVKLAAQDEEKRTGIKKRMALDLDRRGEAYVAELRDLQATREKLGISGRVSRARENRSGNDSTITRFGWKAQNKSLLMFAGEAYNVEQGVTNELFPNERDEEPQRLPKECKINPTPEDQTDYQGLLSADSPASRKKLAECDPSKGVCFATQFAEVASDLVKFQAFMRFLAPAAPACDLAVAGSCSAEVRHGSAVFHEVHCDTCHIRELTVGDSPVKAISDQKVARLYSDLLLHRMGDCPSGTDHRPKCLADGISQGGASGDEFRTAPLWGIGQRVFFLHDGRTTDLPTAIRSHKGPGSEANKVVDLYSHLQEQSKQDLIYFLRAL